MADAIRYAIQPYEIRLCMARRPTVLAGPTQSFLPLTRASLGEAPVVPRSRFPAVPAGLSQGNGAWYTAAQCPGRGACPSGVGCSRCGGCLSALTAAEQAYDSGGSSGTHGPGPGHKSGVLVKLAACARSGEASLRAGGGRPKKPSRSSSGRSGGRRRRGRRSAAGGGFYACGR